MDKPRKLIVTGNGRCGTTLMVRLLASFGLDTYFGTHGMPLTAQNGGCEIVSPEKWMDAFVHKKMRPEAIKNDLERLPYVIKLTWMLRNKGATSEFVRHAKIDWLLWCLRDLDEVASLHDYKRYWDWTEWISNSLIEINKLGVPMTLLDYPRLALDPMYLFGKLSSIPVFPDMHFDEFQERYWYVCEPEHITAVTSDQKVARKEAMERRKAFYAEAQSRYSASSGN